MSHEQSRTCSREDARSPIPRALFPSSTPALPAGQDRTALLNMDSDSETGLLGGSSQAVRQRAGKEGRRTSVHLFFLLSGNCIFYFDVFLFCPPPQEDTLKVLLLKK